LSLPFADSLVAISLYVFIPLLKGLCAHIL
jgi:hypothetical protein